MGKPNKSHVSFFWRQNWNSTHQKLSFHIVRMAIDLQFIKLIVSSSSNRTLDLTSWNQELGTVSVKVYFVLQWLLKLSPKIGNAAFI